MRRDIDELHERLDSVIRLAKAVKRTSATTPRVAEEDYEAVHVAVREAEAALAAGWKAWHEAIRAVAALPGTAGSE